MADTLTIFTTALGGYLLARFMPVRWARSWRGVIGLGGGLAVGLWVVVLRLAVAS